MRFAVRDDIQMTELRPADAAAFVKHLADKDIFNRTVLIPWPYTLALAEQFLARAAAEEREAARPVELAIREAGGLAIGCCGFKYGLGPCRRHRAEIGFWLARRYWGQGIMTAVVGGLVDLAFGELGILRLTATVFAEHIAAVRVLEKNGFVREAIMRQHYRKEEHFVDGWLYARLRNDGFVQSG